MEASAFIPKDGLINDLTIFNVKVNRKTFPRESNDLVHNTLNIILGLATSLPQEDQLALPSYAGYVLFPRLILRSLPT